MGGFSAAPIPSGTPAASICPLQSALSATVTPFVPVETISDTIGLAVPVAYNRAGGESTRVYLDSLNPVIRRDDIVVVEWRSLRFVCRVVDLEQKPVYLLEASDGQPTTPTTVLSLRPRLPDAVTIGGAPRELRFGYSQVRVGTATTVGSLVVENGQLVGASLVAAPTSVVPAAVGSTIGVNEVLDSSGDGRYLRLLANMEPALHQPSRSGR